VVEDILTF